MASERIFDSIIGFYERTLDWVLGRRGLTLAGGRGDAGRHRAPVSRRAEGLLPGAGHRARSRGCPKRRRRCRSTKMAQLQQQLAAAILENPAVESLSSFIGVDGTNTTLNSGRIQINLKPLSQRKPAGEVIRRAADRGGRGLTASASTCSRCRTSRSRTSSAAPNTNSACRIRVRPSSRSTRTGSSSGSSSFPSSRMSPATCKTTAGRSSLQIDRPDRLAARASPRRTSTTRSTTHSASGRCRRCSPSSTNTT